MTDLLSQDKLAAIAARCDAATWNGGWYVNGFPGRLPMLIGTNVDVICEFLTGHPRIREKNIRANAEFIARSREDIPALLAHIKAVKDDNASILINMQRLKTAYDNACKEIERLRDGQ